MLTCPVPLQQYPHILLAHGGGGRLMHQLIEQMFIATFGASQPQHDAAVLAIHGQQIAFTTDSYVVNPLFFPGGDIGSLAVHGTVNDLAMAGARPLYLSLGLILEEGLPMEILWQVVQSMKQAADRCHIHIVTGDTKVVDRGKGDGIFINTTGIGVIEHEQVIAPISVQPEDVILLSGDLGRHGIAVMAARSGFEFETTIASDSAPLADLVAALLKAGVTIHCLRDLTRGGLASALNEIAIASQLDMLIQETKIPVHETVQGACEILGLDPLYIANEGRLVAMVPPADAEAALVIMQDYAQMVGTTAQAIGHVESRRSHTASVILQNQFGSHRFVEMLSGEQLPRIC
jgi:hydrogenase expression/formation protein HypE